MLDLFLGVVAVAGLACAGAGLALGAPAAFMMMEAFHSAAQQEEKEQGVTYPTLEILADNAAVIVNDGARLELKGPGARAIVTAYRHCLAHEGAGEALAAFYLLGVLDGLRHDELRKDAAALVERTRMHRRELDRLVAGFAGPPSRAS